MGIVLPQIMIFKIFIMMLALVFIIPIVNTYIINPILQGSTRFELDRLWKVVSDAAQGNTASLPDKFYLYKNQMLMQIYGGVDCGVSLSRVYSGSKSYDDYSGTCAGKYCICVVSWDSSSDFFFDPNKINAPSWWTPGDGVCNTMKSGKFTEITEKGKGNVDSCKAIKTKDECMDAKEEIDAAVYETKRHKPCVWNVTTDNYQQIIASDIYFTSYLDADNVDGASDSSCANILTEGFIKDNLKNIHCRPIPTYDDIGTTQVENTPIMIQKPTLDVDAQLPYPSVFLWALSGTEFNVDGGIVASKVNDREVELYFRFGG